MEKPDLKVVGEIAPPDYKNPAKMLRDIADSIENGDYGDIDTVVVATFGDGGLETFGGGKESGLYACTYVFGSAAARFHMIPWVGA